MNTIGIIPARMASSRFPGKPLAEINGIPMVGHVYFRSKMSRTLDEVYVATCDEEIRKYVEGVGGRVVMTKDTHERASDRTAEAMLKVEEARGAKVDIVVMIQGDEPMLLPQMIDEAVNPLRSETGVNVVNLMAPLRSKEEHEDSNEVKVVVDQEGFALYFSREPIPSRKKWKEQIPMFKQVCIIPFRREYLIRFNELVSTPLEKVESVDMLRVLEHGEKVRMVLTAFDTYSVDTPEDLRKVARMMAGDSLVAQYSRKA